MCCPPKKNLLGFTLVELLIVVTIIVIVTGAAIPSFVGYIRSQTLVQGVEQVKSDLRTVQNKALVGAQATTLLGGNPVQYWGVRFSSGSGGVGSGTYEYFISTNNTSCPTGALVSPQLQGTVSLSSEIDIKITGAGAYKCVFFSLADGGASVAAANSTDTNNRVIVGYVGTTANGNCRKVSFNSNGLIYFVHNAQSTNCNYN